MQTPNGTQLNFPNGVTFKVDAAGAARILLALGYLPFRDVVDLINDLQGQLFAQNVQPPAPSDVEPQS
jgi:hypothetical protein